MTDILSKTRSHGPRSLYVNTLNFMHSRKIGYVSCILKNKSATFLLNCYYYNVITSFVLYFLFKIIEKKLFRIIKRLASFVKEEKNRYKSKNTTVIVPKRSTGSYHRYRQSIGVNSRKREPRDSILLLAKKFNKSEARSATLKSYSIRKVYFKKICTVVKIRVAHLKPEFKLLLQEEYSTVNNIVNFLVSVSSKTPLYLSSFNVGKYFFYLTLAMYNFFLRDSDHNEVITSQLFAAYDKRYYSVTKTSSTRISAGAVSVVLPVKRYFLKNVILQNPSDLRARFSLKKTLSGPVNFALDYSYEFLEYSKRGRLRFRLFREKARAVFNDAFKNYVVTSKYHDTFLRSTPYLFYRMYTKEYIQTISNQVELEAVPASIVRVPKSIIVNLSKKVDMTNFKEDARNPNFYIYNNINLRDSFYVNLAVSSVKQTKWQFSIGKKQYSFARGLEKYAG